MAKSPKFYVVWKGREPGVYATWNDCKAQVHGFAGAQYKSFESRRAAEVAFRESHDRFVGRGATADRRTAEEFGDDVILDSVSVDAACAGNPGVLEYRGVETSTGDELFREGPFPEGTVNIGEFLAIVHALAMLQNAGRTCPIYSDSQIARGWVRDRCPKTTLPRTPVNEALFRLIDRANQWLAVNTYPNEVLCWQTRKWGENPADFGRK